MALGSVLEVEPLEKVKSGILYPKAAIYGEGSLGYKWVLESMLVVLGGMQTLLDAQALELPLSNYFAYNLIGIIV